MASEPCIGGEQRPGRAKAAAKSTDAWAQRYRADAERVDRRVLGQRTDLSRAVQYATPLHHGPYCGEAVAALAISSSTVVMAATAGAAALPASCRFASQPGSL